MTADVFTLGEAMLRLSVRRGHRLETARALDVDVAGAEANVAATLARLGRSVIWFSRLPDGPLGRRVLSDLVAAGVDCSRVALIPGARLGFYFVELHGAPRPIHVIYDRTGSAAAAMTAGDVPMELVEAARVVHVSGITPALSTSCGEAVLAVAKSARAARGTLLNVDVNYRAKLWAPAAAAAFLEELLPYADSLVCSAGDARTVFGMEGTPADLARRLGGRFGIPRVVVTQGAEGAWWWHEGTEGQVEALPVELIDRLGAGDAFNAGVIDGLLDGSLESGVRRGAALAAVALSSRGDRAVISRSEIDDLLRRGPSDVVDR